MRTLYEIESKPIQFELNGWLSIVSFRKLLRKGMLSGLTACMCALLGLLLIWWAKDYHFCSFVMHRAIMQYAMKFSSFHSQRPDASMALRLYDMSTWYEPRGLCYVGFLRAPQYRANYYYSYNSYEVMNSQLKRKRWHFHAYLHTKSIKSQ